MSLEADSTPVKPLDENSLANNVMGDSGERLSMARLLTQAKCVFTASKCGDLLHANGKLRKHLSTFMLCMRGVRIREIKLKSTIKGPKP